MRNLTRKKLAEVAAELLDQGGQEAVTIRAVAEKLGVSHNAPYRHFRDRSSLLAGVAERDFESLTVRFQAAADKKGEGFPALKLALDAFSDYALSHPARYRLLFSDPSLEATDDLRKAAFAPFEIFVKIIARCQNEGRLPAVDPVGLAGLIYATLHGAIDLEIGGRASETKGLKSVSGTVDLLLSLLNPLSA